jgi:hypothetical protein
VLTKADFVNVERLTPMLLPKDLREWVQENDKESKDQSPW